MALPAQLVIPLESSEPGEWELIKIEKKRLQTRMEKMEPHVLAT